MRYCIWNTADGDEDSWYIDAEDLGDAAIVALSDMGYAIAETDEEYDDLEDPPFVPDDDDE
jgi:hypothetical protein